MREPFVIAADSHHSLSEAFEYTDEQGLPTPQLAPDVAQFQRMATWSLLLSAALASLLITQLLIDHRGEEHTQQQALWMDRDPPDRIRQPQTDPVRVSQSDPDDSRQ